LPLTFHADEMKLICHICNYRSAPAAVCPECSHTEFKFIGGGTKRIEAEIARLLPEARLARLDKDSADPKLLPELYRQLHGREIDILIGTQMIAKGLDLPHLDTVGVINADTMLHMPDFSAAERTYQLLAQVAGRAGRGESLGRVFIQTHSPDHPAIRLAAANDFWGFAAQELAGRQLLGYPPYRYLLKLAYSHAQPETARLEAEKIANELSQQSQIRLLGPAPAFYERAGGKYHWHLIVKAASRPRLIDIAAKMPASWKTDLDPVNLL
jgi:primosomal protein N' (replication factor Y)